MGINMTISEDVVSMSANRIIWLIILVNTLLDSIASLMISMCEWSKVPLLSNDSNTELSVNSGVRS